MLQSLMKGGDKISHLLDSRLYPISFLPLHFLLLVPCLCVGFSFLAAAPHFSLTLTADANCSGKLGLDRM